MERNNNRFLIPIFLLFTIAVVLRLVVLSEYPQYIHNDEVATAFDMLPFLKTPMESPLWGYTLNGGHSNLSVFMSAIPAYFTDRVDLFTLRLATALSGIGSILFFSFALSRLYGRGVMCLFLVAVGPYFFHIHYSRSGYNYIHAALFTAILCWSFAYFQQALSSRTAFFMGGVLGLSVMTYSVSYILPAPVACAMLWIAISDQFRDKFFTQRLKHALRLGLISLSGFLIILGPQIIYTAMHGFSTSSRLRSQSLFVHTQNTDLFERITTFLQKFWMQLMHTTDIFFRADGARQGVGPLIAEPVSQTLVVVGTGILLFRCIKRDPFAMLVLSIVLFSVLGSALMIEANFSPHFILLTIVLPYVGILPLEVLYKRFLAARPALFVAWLVVLLIPWTWWNYQHWIEADRRRGDLNTWLLRLPIDRDGIKSFANCSPYYADIRERMYTLMYPNAKRETLSFDEPIASLSAFLAKESCPCVVLFEHKNENLVEKWLQEQHRNFTKLRNTTGTVFVIE